MSDTFKKDLVPLFYEYGAACYEAENLESTLRALLVVNRSAQDRLPISPSAIKEIEIETSKDALFALFERAKKVEYFTPAEERKVKAAMKVRNELIHHYWETNIKKTLTPEGRTSVSKDLRKIAERIREANRIVTSLVDRYLIEYGLSTEICKQIAEGFYEPGPDSREETKH